MAQTTDALLDFVTNAEPGDALNLDSDRTRTRYVLQQRHARGKAAAVTVSSARTVHHGRPTFVGSASYCFETSYGTVRLERVQREHGAHVRAVLPVGEPGRPSTLTPARRFSAAGLTQAHAAAMA